MLLRIESTSRLNVLSEVVTAMHVAPERNQFNEVSTEHWVAVNGLICRINEAGEQRKEGWAEYQKVTTTPFELVTAWIEVVSRREWVYRTHVRFFLGPVLAHRKPDDQFTVFDWAGDMDSYMRRAFHELTYALMVSRKAVRIEFADGCNIIHQKNMTKDIQALRRLAQGVRRLCRDVRIADNHIPDLITGLASKSFVAEYFKPWEKYGTPLNPTVEG